MHVRPALLPWTADFLTDREQCVRLLSHTSDWSRTTCGVPQGTKVGPVVFLAMVNDVASDAPHRWKYVDDITVGESSNPSAPPGMETQRAMDSISECAQNNHMSLNVAKCGVMQCTFSKVPPPRLHITAHDQTVPNLPSMTLLGVTLLPSLKWDQHIETVISRANSTVGASF